MGIDLAELAKSQEILIGQTSDATIADAPRQELKRAKLAGNSQDR